MKLKYKIWIENETKIFGKGPNDLLSGVEKYGSLAESAHRLNMSYNKAFTLIKSIEGQLGYKLISSKSGGAKGGGSVLTEEAKTLMSKYQSFLAECDVSLSDLFQKYFVNM